MEDTEEVKVAVDSLSEPDFDALLLEARKEFHAKRGPQYSLPEMLGEYTAIEGKRGLYLRPMCLEAEMRLIELYDFVGDGSNYGRLRVATGLASACVFRANLPQDEADARRKILDYVRGNVTEEEIFAPVSEAELGRLFKSTDELTRLVLDPLEIKFGADGKEESPNP